MVDEEPMPLEVLVGLVQLVKSGRRGTPGWPTKGAIVLAIGAQRLGGWFTAEDAAEATGRARGTCARLLVQLDDERVILRDPGIAGEGKRGAGGFLYWVEVNPRWEDWRVSWRVPRRVVRQRAVLLREAAQQLPLERFFARSYDARYPRISARLWTREKVEQEAAQAAFSRVSWTREFGSSDRPLRAKSGGLARSGTTDSRVHGRANFGPAAGRGRGTSSARALGSDEVLLPVPGMAPPVGTQEASVNRKHWNSLKALVLSRCLPGGDRTRPALWGDPARQLHQLLADHGFEDCQAAAEKIPAGEHQPPSFVDAMDMLLSAGELPGPVAAAGGAQSLAVERRRQAELAEVRTHIGSLEAMGANDFELAEWREREASLEAQVSGPTMARAPAPPDVPEW